MLAVGRSYTSCSIFINSGVFVINVDLAFWESSLLIVTWTYSRISTSSEITCFLELSTNILWWSKNSSRFCIYSKHAMYSFSFSSFELFSLSIFPSTRCIKIVRSFSRSRSPLASERIFSTYSSYTAYRGLNSWPVWVVSKTAQSAHMHVSQVLQ